MRKAVLIDRDGTIGPESNVVYPTQLHPFPGIAQAVRKLHAQGWLVLAVTNQSSIARGTAGDYDFMEEFHSYGLDDAFICPHDTADDCDCRKPRPGLLLQARDKYDLDLSACYVVGDRWSDIDAGKTCGCKTILVLTGRGKESLLEDREVPPDHVAADIFQATDWICHREGAENSMGIKGVDHITINLKEVDQSLWFYGELLGFSPLPQVDMGDHLLRYFALPGGGKLELTEYRYATTDTGAVATDQGRVRHLAFVVDDVYQIEKTLTAAGYPFHVPVSFVEKLGFHGGLTRDPNGFELEFLQYI